MCFRGLKRRGLVGWHVSEVSQLAQAMASLHVKCLGMNCGWQELLRECANFGNGLDLWKVCSKVIVHIQPNVEATSGEYVQMVEIELIYQTWDELYWFLLLWIVRLKVQTSLQCGARAAQANESWQEELNIL